MRIWIVNHYAAPKSGASGVRHAVLAERLQQRGHEVTVFAAAVRHLGGAARGGVSLPAQSRFADQILAGVRWRFVRVSSYANSLQRLLSMRSFARNLLQATGDLPAPDVIIGSTVHPYAVDASARLARRRGACFVYEIRDIWPESLADLGVLPAWNPLYWHLRHLERKAFRQADGVIVLFPGMPGYAQRHGVPPDRLCYLPNGVDPSLYSRLGDPPASGPFVVSFFGAHGAANGLNTLLDAATLLQKHVSGREVRIRLVGEGTHKPALQQQAHRLGLANVEFLDGVPRPELVELGRQSHAFVFCLRRMPVIVKYGMSANKLFEYLMWERPVVFSCDSFNDPVAEARAGLSVPAEDPRQLADGILSLRDVSVEERRQMGYRGREYVVKHHDLSRHAESLESFLLSLSTTAGEPRRVLQAA